VTDVDTTDDALAMAHRRHMICDAVRRYRTAREAERRAARAEVARLFAAQAACGARPEDTDPEDVGALPDDGGAL
jgi:hypothetical protein